MNTILTPIKRAIILGCALLGMTQAVQTRVALSRRSGATAGRMQRFPAVRSLTGFLVAVLLASCGGGGDGGPGIPEISAASPPPGATGVAYPGYTFTVASGGAAPFTWSETGALPPDLSLSTTGQLSGTPVTAGTYPITIAVADSSTPSLTGTISVSLVIDDSPIVINPALPPAGIVNNSYAGFVFNVASGGSPPFGWLVTSGALPTGLTLASNGSLSGTPTAAASFTFTITVTDSFATPATNSMPFSIMVSEPLAPTINSAQPPTAIEGVVYPPFTFTASDGLAPLVWSETGRLPGLAFSLDGVLSGTPSGAGKFPITLDVKDALNRSAPSAPVTVRVAPARPPASFTSTGSMSVARFGHAATLLLDGKVLITGGDDGSGLGLASAELYDPSTGLFTATTGGMTVARIAHTATLLNNAALPNYGKVLISGGDPSGAASAELYDPATGTFAATGNMTVARAASTATLLNTGKVLVAGGHTDTADIYDPATETFSATGSMTIARYGHMATLLNNAALPNYGKVLIAGGDESGAASAELYDPATGTFAATDSMTVARTGHTATRLQDGTVLVVGTDDGNPDLYDPGTGSFTAVGYLWSLFANGHTASLRADGSVLIAGGRRVVTTYSKISHLCIGKRGAGNTLSTATALYAPEAGGFTATGPLTTARVSHTATVLSDGTALLVGGFQYTVVVDRTHCTTTRTATALSSAELYR